MKRLLIALCLIPAPAAVAASDIIYQNPRWGFEIIQPSGWKITTPVESAGTATVRVNFRGPVPGTVCNIAAMDAPATRQSNQSQINRAVSQGVLADATLNETRSGMDSNARRVSARIVDVDGLTAQEVELRATYVAPDKERINLAQISLGLAVPGRTYFVNCTAVPEAYDRLKPEFQRIQQSLRITLR